MPNYYDSLLAAKQTGKPAIMAGDKYMIFSAPQGFHVLSDVQGTEFNEGKWKFHLSVDKADLGKAWDVVVNELGADKKVEHHAKVADTKLATAMNDPANPQAGKAITIYTNKDVPPEHYAQLMERIEGKFKEQGIKPGPETHSDRKIPGSSYAAYRSDKGANGRYMAGYEVESLPREQRHNPGNAPDPFAKVAFGKQAPLSGPQQDRGRQLIQGAEKHDVVTGGKPVRYIDVHGMSPAEVAEVKATLARHDIRSGEKISSALGNRPVITIPSDGLDKFDRMLHPPGTAHQAAPSLDQGRERLAKAEVHDVVDRTGKPAKYIDVNKIDQPGREQIKAALQHQGVSFSERKSSMNGGMDVLAVPETEFAKLESLRATKPSPHLGGKMGGIIGGAALALAAGGAAAAQPNANATSVVHAAAGAAIPGYGGAKEGSVCKSFGEVAGYVVSGAATTAVAGLSATAAAGVTAASGPAAPVVGVATGMLATTATLATAAATYSATESAATAACQAASGTVKKLTQKFGL